MASTTYDKRRVELETYFDRTAVEAWARLTSTAPVGRVRRTVRAGRDAMRARLLSWLPDDLSGRRILDAGCGTGAFAVEAARRGADVVAIDLSATLVGLAEARAPRDSGGGSIIFKVGDMLDPALGRFDHVVAMDSLIHYGADDIARVLGAIAPRTSRSMLVTIAPKTAFLMAFWALGRAFPRQDRAPAIEPVSAKTLCTRMGHHASLAGWSMAERHRITSGFYISEALRIVNAGKGGGTHA